MNEPAVASLRAPDADTVGAAAPLQLGARQRAMLQEMGVRLWWPQAPLASAFASALPGQDDGAQKDGEVASLLQAGANVCTNGKDASSQDLAVTARATGIAPAALAMPDAGSDVKAAQAAFVATPAAARLHPASAQAEPDLRVGKSQLDTRQPNACPLNARTPVVPQRAYALHDGQRGEPAHAEKPPASGGHAVGAARWLLVLDPPGLEELPATEQRAQADVRRLLMNMVAAVRLEPYRVHHMCAAQCVVAPGQMLSEAELAPWRASLWQEMQRLQPQLLLCMGRHAAYSVLGSSAPLGQLRGQAHRMAWSEAAACERENNAGMADDAAQAAGGRAELAALVATPVVVTFPPAYLLRTPAAKREAWQDLCLAHALSQLPLQA